MNINPASSYQNTQHKYIDRANRRKNNFSNELDSKSKEISKVKSETQADTNSKVQSKSEAKPERQRVKQDGIFRGRFALVNTRPGRGKLVSINYSIESTDEDPIMLSSEGDTVHINAIDPSSASELEMQMLCAHLDATGKGTDSTFGTYNDLVSVRMTAHMNGFSQLGLSRDNHSYKEVKSNWIDLTNEVMKVVRGNDKKQYEALETLYDGINKRKASIDKYK